MPQLLAVTVEGHPHGQAGPVLLRLQGAPAVRQGLRQHGNDAVGKVDRVAASRGLAVERAIRAHVVGDVGDRHQHAPAAGVLGIVVRLGVDGVVEVAGIGAVDGDQGKVPQVLAPGLVGRSRGGRFGQNLLGEDIGDALLVERDETEGLRVVESP